MRKKLTPNPKTTQKTVAAALLFAPSVDVDALDTATTQLDLPQLLRPNKKDPSMADIDKDAELLVSAIGTDNGPTTAVQQQEQPQD